MKANDVALRLIGEYVSQARKRSSESIRDRARGRHVEKPQEAAQETGELDVDALEAALTKQS